MRRRTIRPFGQSISSLRLISAFMAMMVLWMLFHRLKDPATWKGFVGDAVPPVHSAEVSRSSVTMEVDPVVPHPDDRDIEEQAAIHDLFEFVTDRSPLKVREMDAYWRLMEWSRGQTFLDLERRAAGDVPFTQLWEQPDRYRGKPIRLKLHVRRVIEYDAPDNPSGIMKVCEAWGWTDESRSFPYVIVFTDPPQGLPIGTDVRAEVAFAGYFLKNMSYTAFDRVRAAPLLIGRIQFFTPRIEQAEDESLAYGIIVIGIGAIIVVGFSFWTTARTRQIKQRVALPDQWAQVESLPADELKVSDPF